MCLNVWVYIMHAMAWRGQKKESDHLELGIKLRSFRRGTLNSSLPHIFPASHILLLFLNIFFINYLIIFIHVYNICWLFFSPIPLSDSFQIHPFASQLCVLLSFKKNNPLSLIFVTHILVGVRPPTGVRSTYQKPHSPFPRATCHWLLN